MDAASTGLASAQDSIRPAQHQETVQPSRRGVAWDLFCGGGPLALGAEQAGFDIALGADIEPVHAAVHDFNFAYGRSVAVDLAKVSGADLRAMSECQNEVDLVTLGRSPDFLLGGPPCQGVSSIGRRDYDDPRNALMKHFQRHVEESQCR